MVSLNFHFEVLPANDHKTNLLCVTRLTNKNGVSYRFPVEYMPVTEHEALMKTAPAIKAKNSLKKRHQLRNVWIEMTQELANIYIDKEGNMQFGEQYLEEIIEKTVEENAGLITNKELKTLLEKLCEQKPDFEKNKNLRKAAEKFVLEKFSGKNQNAPQWLEIFEQECSRFEINEDEEKIELFRLFLENSAVDWYGSMLLKNTIKSEWKIWSDNFSNTFIDKGWSYIRYAISFKYISGPLLDYALKKEKILLQMYGKIDPEILISLIATGLPNFYIDKIDRNNLKTVEDLFNALRGLEHLVKKLNEKKFVSTNTKSKEKIEKKPCSICEKENKGIRFHPESSCWFNKTTVDEKQRKYESKQTNMSKLELELIEPDPKN